MRRRNILLNFSRSSPAFFASSLHFSFIIRNIIRSAQSRKKEKFSSSLPLPRNLFSLSRDWKIKRRRRTKNSIKSFLLLRSSVWYIAIHLILGDQFSSFRFASLRFAYAAGYIAITREQINETIFQYESSALRSYLRCVSYIKYDRERREGKKKLPSPFRLSSPCFLCICCWCSWAIYARCSLSICDIHFERWRSDCELRRELRGEVLSLLDVFSEFSINFRMVSMGGLRLEGWKELGNEVPRDVWSFGLSLWNYLKLFACSQSENEFHATLMGFESRARFVGIHGSMIH